METRMNQKKWIYWTFIFSIIFAFSTAAMAANQEINWYSYKAGMEKISKENKKGYIHFYTDWCTYCKIMNQKTFTDDSVIAFLNQNFVPIRVNAEEQRDVAKKYGVSKFPNNWFIGEDKSEIGKRPGFIPAEIMLKMLQYVSSDSFKNMSFQDYMDSSQ
mgnify:CR=1 FL=1